jgi:hypothetical protein
MTAPDPKQTFQSKRSLIGPVPAYRVRVMFAQAIGRQIAALVVTLGLFLGGVGPSWAIPAASNDNSRPAMAMTVTDMPMPCAEMRGSTSPAKQVPLKGNDSSCGVCIACAVNVLPQGFSPVTLFYRGEVRTVLRDANRNDVATPPPLPPPILHA